MTASASPRSALLEDQFFNCRFVLALNLDFNLSQCGQCQRLLRLEALSSLYEGQFKKKKHSDVNDSNRVGIVWLVDVW